MSLADFLSEYACGASTLYKLEERLRFDARREAYDQARKDARLLPRLAAQTCGRAWSPEEIVLERERFAEIAALCEAVRAFLGEADFKLFCLLALEGRRQQAAAERLGISQQAVSKRYGRVCAKLHERFGKVSASLLASEAKEALLPRPSARQTGGGRMKLRVPSDFLSERGARPIGETACQARAYLDAAYGDEKTCCAYCDRCSDAQMRYRNAEPRIKKYASAVVKGAGKSVSI